MGDVVRYVAGYEHDLQGTPISETATVTVLRELSMCTLFLESIDGVWSKDVPLDAARALFYALRLALADTEDSPDLRIPSAKIQLRDRGPIKVAPTQSGVVQLHAPDHPVLILSPEEASKLAASLTASAAIAGLLGTSGDAS